MFKMYYSQLLYCSTIFKSEDKSFRNLKHCFKIPLTSKQVHASEVLLYGQQSPIRGASSKGIL